MRTSRDTMSTLGDLRTSEGYRDDTMKSKSSLAGLLAKY